MQKKVAVILVNWNGFTLSADCICSLQQMAYNNYDIIVVDNGSEDGSVKKLKDRFSHIIILESETNLGFTGGNNLGIQYAINHGYEYVLLLNNDTFVKEDFLEILVSYMDKHTDTGVIQPKILYHHNRSLLWNGGSYFNPWLGNTFEANTRSSVKQTKQKVKKVDWVSGCAFFTRVSILNESGLLAENMFMYYEDVDLSFRIRQNGRTCIYYPDSVIYHIAGMATKSNIKSKEGFINPLIHYYSTRNRIWLIKKYTPLKCIPTSFVYNSFYLAAILVYLAVRGRFVKFRMVLKGIRDGIKGKISYS